MFNKKLMIMAIFIVSLLVISAVSANELNATDEVAIDDESLIIGETSDDISQDEVLSAKDDGTFKALQNKIDNAASGSTLSLENDYNFNEDTDYDRWGSGYVTIRKDLVIDGKGHTIDAKHLTSVFDIWVSGDVTLKNINFKNAYHSGGGSNGRSASTIYFRGVDSSNNGSAFSVIGCSFVNCYNDQDGGAIAFENQGYGLVTDCNFLNCSAKSGAAIYCADNVFRCSFEECSSNSFGVIYGSKNVVDCSFLDCFGKAIYSGGVVNNCNFMNCSDFWQGTIDGVDDVVDCNFKCCSGLSGAAIAHAKNVKGCSFMDCLSPIIEGYGSSGGAIIGAESVVNCYFRNCSARDGGAIYGVDNVDGCTFVDCSAVEGGAIYAPRKVTNSNFTNNMAEKGGAMYVSYYYNPAIAYCNFKDNSKNGQIFFDTALTYYCDSYSKCTLSNLNFEGNGLNYAGGISFANNILTVMENKQYLPSDSGDVIDLSKLVYLSGDVSINIAGKTFKTSLDSGIAKFDLNSVGDGTYDATISYSGCDVAPALEIKMPLTIKSSINIQANNIEKYYGGSEKYTVALTNNGAAIANANVKISIDGKAQTVKTNSKGQASVDLNLGVGTHNVVSEYEGVSKTSKVTVKSTITANDVAGTYSNAKATATFLGTAGKALANTKVTFKIGTSSYSATTNSNGVASANIPLGVGTYTVTAVNPTTKEEKQFKLTISKASSTTSLTATQNGKSVTLTAAVTPSAATGKVTFEINGKTKEASLNNGKASVTFSDLSANTYPAKATYGGDSNFMSSSASASVKVDKVYSITNVGDTKGTYLNSKVSATFLDANGKALTNTKVTFKAGGKTYSATTNSNGAATASIDLGVGTYDVTAVNPSTKEEKQFKLTIDKATPEFTLKASKTSGVEGMVTITATFAQNAVTGEVMVSDESSMSYVHTIADGQVAVNTFYALNQAYDVTVSYSGDNNFKAVEKKFSFNVSNAKLSNVMTVSGSSSGYYWDTKYLTVTVKDYEGKPVANQNITVNMKGLYFDDPDSDVFYLTTGSDGKAKLKLYCDYVPDKYELCFSSKGCDDVCKTFTIKKEIPKITAKAKTFKKSVKIKKYSVTVKNHNNKPLKKEKITIKVKGVVYTAKTNSKGVATFKINKLNKKGKYTAKIFMYWESYYKSVTKSVKITVK